MAVTLVQHHTLSNVFDLVVHDTYCWRAPASWWRAQTRESLSAIGADDLDTSVDAVLAAIEKALPSDVARVVSELRQAAGLPADYPYTHEFVALRAWIAAHRDMHEGLVALLKTNAPEQIIHDVKLEQRGRLRGEELETRLSEMLKADEQERDVVDIVRDLHHWEPLLRESLERVLRAVTGKADVLSMVGEIGTPGFDALIEHIGCERAVHNDWDEELARIKDRHEHELRTQTNMRHEVAEALGLERAAPIVKIIAEARRRAGAVTRLREVCAAVLGIKVSEVDADPDVEAVIADMWKAPRRAVPEALFGRLLADLGAEASRVLGATPTDLVYSADHKDDTMIGRIKECIRDSDMLRKRDLRSIDPAAPPPVVYAAEEIKRLRALVDRQGNELGELRKVTGGPTDLELRRMICQDVVQRGNTIARQEHLIDSLRTDLREAEAALRSEHERTAEVSLAAQQEVRRTIERVDDVLSRVVSVENTQRMHDLLGEAPDADDHVTRLLARYADTAGERDSAVMPTTLLDHPEECESNHTVAGRNNSESVESDLAETLRATRQDAAELETEVARLQGEVDASIECCKERDAWRTWALRGLPDMSDRTDEQLRCAWSDRAAAFAYRCLSQGTAERLYHLLDIDGSVHADEAVHQLCEEYTRQCRVVDRFRGIADAIGALREMIKSEVRANVPVSPDAT